jgi:hypothetical protein
VSAAAWAFIFPHRRTVRKKTNRRGDPPKKTARQRPTACKLTHSKFSKSYIYKNQFSLNENFDCVQTVQAVIRSHFFILSV